MEKVQSNLAILKSLIAQRHSEGMKNVYFIYHKDGGRDWKYKKKNIKKNNLDWQDDTISDIDVEKQLAHLTRSVL